MRSHQSKLQLTVYIATASFILLLGIIAAIVWSEKSSTPAVQANRELTSVEITRPGYANIKLDLSDARWQLSSPCIAIANPQRIQAFEQLLISANHSYSATEVDLAAAGLVDPLATIAINGTSIKIGATDLSGERRYIQRNNRVEFAPEWILSLIQGGTSAFAQLNVFPDALTSISVSGIPTDDTATQLQQWQSLSANQVIAWPLTENVPELVQSYSVTYQTPTETAQLLVNEYEAFSAIVKSDEHCAYIVSNAAVPAL